MLHYTIYFSFNDNFIRGKRCTIICQNLRECYYRLLHYAKDNPYYNLRFLSIYEVKESGYQELKFFFELDDGNIYLHRGDIHTTLKAGKNNVAYV